MLVNLKINNFALVDSLELNLENGLSVLTGETGAGKSIILDAIDIVLGGKPNVRMIRSGSDRTIIEATFNVSPGLSNWLCSQEIDPFEEDTLICSREIVIGKTSLRSRSRVNGVVVNRQLMNDLRSRLVEITAQGQTVNLLISEKQRDLLDAYGGKLINNQTKKVTEVYEIANQAKKELEQIIQSEQDLLQRQDWLEFRLKDLNEAELNDPDELDELEQERDRLSHVVELQQLGHQAYQMLYEGDRDEPAAADLLGKAESCLMEMAEYDTELSPILEMVQSGLAQIVEAGQQISSYSDGLETDPERLSEIESRIKQLKEICRKYGPDLSDAIALSQQLQQELKQITDGEQSIAALQQEHELAEKQLIQECQKLTQLRQKAATKLEKQLVKELKPLAMEKVIFECRLESSKPTAKGADKVVFYFSPNAGETAQPLSLIASGGEMSRFLLALKSCFTGAEESSSTLIFDEIDAGVSGKVAQAIAEKLHQLGKQHQVLCVTHQPLIAAMANGHFKVEKTIIEEKSPDKKQNGSSTIPDIRTVVRIKSLGEHTIRVEELAQITGGHSADDAIAFAESLLAKAAKYRASS
ncbi:DNA repair protein RecN [Waterburya agarophytonicola K14]|uniref:DNA repair protein RecN n=1 Tax=Waterburya agarophytonicola KI4 TaxID=2874699 RepID=A0A964BQS3_9CYAN|nr:DNA repair protein RecN [Waterburya agarophytonicola]MCC0177918.1 DNA repair protein RecN [Waterburya agarophytonicola KI4]